MITSNLCEFVIFKFQPVAHIGAEGQQGDGDFGDHAGLVVLDEGVITADIHNGTEHNILLLKNRPGNPGRSLFWVMSGISPCTYHIEILHR